MTAAQPPLSAQRWAGALLLLAGAVAFWIQLRYVWPFTADDAFITFRYARNWVVGFGPNFNADGAHTEGVTSFGYLLVSCLPAALGIDPVAFAKGLGVAAALATAWLASRLARELGGEMLAGAFAAALFLAFHATAIHVASGMETLLAAGLLTALVAAHGRFERGGSARAIGALSLALGLVRPELNAVAGLLLALTWLRARERRAALLRAAAGWYLVPGAVYFAARAAYYDHLFPIPFYAKLPGGELFPATAGVLGFAAALLAPVAIFLAIAALLSPARVLAPAWLAAGAVLTLALLPDPVMNFDYRYAMPAAGVLTAVAGVGFAQLCALAVRARPQRAGSVVVALALAAIAFLGATGLEPARSALRERRAYGQALDRTYVKLGRELAAYRRGSARLPTLAIGDAGAIPYYSGWRVIDTFSLNDPAIAIEGRAVPGYVLDQAPELVAVVSEQGREFHAHWANRHDGPLFEAARARGMEPAVILTFSARSYLYLMARPGSEIARYLRRIYLDPQRS